MATVDITLTAPDGSTVLTMKAERVQMDVVRSPMVTDIVAKTMVAIDVGKVRREFNITGVITTDAALGSSKAQLESIENASLNWYALFGNGTTGGPIGTSGRGPLVIGKKSDGTTNKTYMVYIKRFTFIDDAIMYGGTGDKFNYTLTLVEVGDALNTLSTSG